MCHHLFLNIIMTMVTISQLEPDGNFGVIKARGLSHGPVRHYILASLDVIVSKAVGQHLLMNIIPNNFTVNTRQKISCDWGMRIWSHRPVSFQTPSISICDCNSVKSGGPTSISEHNPQQCHSWNRKTILVWYIHPHYQYSHRLEAARNKAPNGKAEGVGALTNSGSEGSSSHKVPNSECS